MLELLLLVVLLWEELEGRRASNRLRLGAGAVSAANCGVGGGGMGGWLFMWRTG